MLSKDDELRLLGLKFCMQDIQAKIDILQEAACSITMEDVGGHTCDWLWEKDEKIGRLKERLENDPMKASKLYHPEEAA